MRRRRSSFRRPFRRSGLRQVPPELRRANELMETGFYAEAGSAFEKIARRADARREPRTPLFFMRAGRAFILAGDPAKGMPQIKNGLSMIAKRRDWEPLQRLGQRAVDELTEQGYNAEAQEIAVYLASALPKGQVSAFPLPTRINLPTHCPGCGAPVQADEVDWIDNATAECICCGSPVRGEH